MARVLITGANRGIGLALCRQYVQRGDEVIALCRRSSSALEELGVRTLQSLDVARLDDTRRLADEMRGVALDVLINNAGVLRGQSLGEIDDEALQDILAQFCVNALGPLLVTQALLGCLNPGAKVGIITSRMGSLADNTSGGSYGYRMSKAAVNMAGVSLARDLATRGVAVALIHPGYVRTEMTAGQGNVEPAQAARGIIERLDALTLQQSGGFWHANGEPLPW